MNLEIGTEAAKSNNSFFGKIFSNFRFCVFAVSLQFNLSSFPINLSLSLFTHTLLHWCFTAPCTPHPKSFIVLCSKYCTYSLPTQAAGRELEPYKMLGKKRRSLQIFSVHGLWLQLNPHWATWRRSPPFFSRAPETDMSQPGFELLTSCTSGGYASKELSRHINAAFSGALHLSWR